MTDTTHPRRTRGEAVAAARYQHRLAAAGEDTNALFMAHVDRIRALKNAFLTLAASSALADLIDRATARPPKFTPVNFTPHSDSPEPLTCGDDQIAGSPATPAKTQKETQ